MRFKRPLTVLWIVGVLALLGGVAEYWLYRNPHTLWRLVSQCAVDPAHRPCALYVPVQGYALLKDRRGKGQYLLIPTRQIRGIEDALLLHPETPDYLALAWQQRDYVRQAYGRAIPDAFLSLAVNSRRARSQDQLHIHIDCLRADVVAALQAMPEEARQGTITLRGHVWQVTRLAGLSPSPFLRLMGENEATRARHGMVVASTKDGTFLLLEVKAHGLEMGFAEDMQDHRCRVMP